MSIYRTAFYKQARGRLLSVHLMLILTLSLQDKLESVLDLSHQQMEQYQEQPAHAHKIAYQQRLLQEDLVTIRAQISRVSTVSMTECYCINTHFTVHT